MKKNANILEYVEKYKYKYGISYAVDGGKLVKTLGVLTGIVWVYLFFMLALSILSFALNFSAGVLNYSDLSSVFITTIVCAVVMIAAAALFVCKQKIAGCIVAIAVQPFIVLAYAPISVYGVGYLPSFYWKFAVPAALLILFAAVLLFVLIRARVKTNKLYSMLVEGLYKQYGTRDSEKLTDSEWDEFLTNYNPYKQVL
ncbi:MAG: hypothetical protein IJY79_03770 [Clostridia bacterium]|nr:hypothetical protein [Clostridia bacterium]